MSSHASLNHIYRTVWNQALGAMVAVAEISSSQGRSSGASSSQARVQSGSPLTRLGRLSLGIALAWGAVQALANPVGGVATHGQASLSASQPNSLLVTTQNGAGTNHTAINWQSFSIPSGNTTYFQQPNAGSTVINRVVTNTPSLIFGTLGSNGHVVLVNQSGIAVGAGAVVDTAGFTAAALGMSDADALSGRLRFGSAGPVSTAGISVQGQIMARGGDLVLIAPKLDTGSDALLQAPNGSTILAAGQQVEITGRGLEGIRLQVQAPTDSALNLGSLQGNAVGMFASTLKHSGLIQANAVSVEGGKVLLKAQDQLEVEGHILAQGRDGQGGVVHATAHKVALKSTSRIDASGASGGGEVLVGGGWQGHDARLENAQQTVVATGAQISADATAQGNGGTAVVWADGTTRFGGSISARGGALGGNGGRAEVSGKQYLDFRGSADLSAPQGRTGLLLLDPDTLTIGTTADVNGDFTSGDDVTGNISSTDFPGGYGSKITATQVSTLLNSADLSLAATGNIDVNSPIAKTTGGATTLTLTSTSGSVNLNASIGGLPASPLNLTISGNAGVTQGYGGIITAPTLIATALGDYSAVSLDGGINNVGNASFTAGSISTGYGGSVNFKNSGALSLGNVKASSLSVNTSAGEGAITQQTGTKIELTSGATFTTRSGSTGGGAVTLNNTGNVIPSLTVNGAGAVSVTEDGTSGITVNAITADSLTLLAKGSVSSLSRTETTGAVNIKSTGGDINYCSDGCGTMVAGGTIKMDASGTLTFGGTLSSSASGDAITLISGGAMSLSGYGGSISTPNGRSLAYVNFGGGRTHNFSLLSPSFKQYNYTTGATILGANNGVIYTNSTAATLTSSFSGTFSKIYDATLGINISGATFGAISSGAIDGDLVTSAVLSGGTGALSNKDVGVGKLINASNMTVSGVSGGNGISTVYGYLTSASGNLGTVTAKTLNMSGLSVPVSKVYDATTAAVVSGTATLTTQAVGSGSTTDGKAYIGDTVNLAGTAVGTYNSKDVASASTVSFSGLTLSGTQASNYSLAAGQTVAASITKKALSATVTAPNKVYDGSTSAAPTLSVSAGLVGSETVTATGTASFNSKDVLAANLVTVNSTALADGSNGGLASNYSLAAGQTVAASITTKALSATVTAPNKVYDGSTTAAPTLSISAGLVGSETVTATGTASFNSKDVLAANLVTVNSTALADGSGLASNYSLAAGQTTAASIQVRPLSNWIASGAGAWSTAANWDALPDASNVLAVAIPAGVTVTYDTTAGATQLASVSSAGTLALTGGSLSVTNSLSTMGYQQTGGTLGGSGSLNVSASFNHSGGTLNVGGSVSITQSTGSLNMGTVSASAIKLSAPNGGITQNAALSTSGLLSTQAMNSIVLNNTGNHVASFSAATTGPGNVELTNVGVLDVKGINAANGNIKLVNTGGISTSGSVVANSGTVSMTANSPLTVGLGGISANGNITLTATNLTSAGNLTLNGNLTSSAGAITLSAANNFVQNSTLTAAQGISVTAGGSMSFGASANSVGNPLQYLSNGQSVMPPGNFTNQSSAPADYVVDFLNEFESTLAVGGTDLLSLPNKDLNATVGEAEICTF